MYIYNNTHVYIGLLTLIAIDGLGGVHSGMSDDVKNNAERHGVGILYFLFSILCGVAVLFIYMNIMETKAREVSLHSLFPSMKLIPLAIRHHSIEDTEKDRLTTSTL